MEAKQGSNQECKIGHPCKADAKLQTSTRMVVLDLTVWEHCSVSFDVVCVERRRATSVVGYAICLCYGLDCYPPNWGHSSNNQPGNLASNHTVTSCSSSSARLSCFRLCWLLSIFQNIILISIWNLSCAATWIWYYSSVHYWLYSSWKANCKSAFQDLWEDQYSSCFVFLIWS